MKILQLGWCLFGKHRRNRRRATKDGRHLRSTCTGCGVPMIRGVNGWTVADRADGSLRD